MKETKYAGTQTEKNLMTAFAGESEARNKYTYFASKAKKEGFEQIAALFLSLIHIQMCIRDSSVSDLLYLIDWNINQYQQTNQQKQDHSAQYC